MNTEPKESWEIPSPAAGVFPGMIGNLKQPVAEGFLKVGKNSQGRNVRLYWRIPGVVNGTQARKELTAS